MTSYRVPTPVENLGNNWKFYLGHSQPGIGWGFVKFVQCCCQKMSQSRKMTTEIIRTFWNEHILKRCDLCFWKVMGTM